GRGALHISARRLPDGGGELRVRDTGPGLSEEARRSLFVPFKTTKPNGSGLGLLLSSRIAEKHGGTLMLADKTDGAKDGAPTGGACFVLCLPPSPNAALPGAHDASHPAVR